MEIQEALRIGYRRELNGNLTLNGQNVPVFAEGSIPDNQPEPYVIITTFTQDQRRTDKCKVFEVTQLLDIVTSSQGIGGASGANSIADQIEEIINPDSRADIDITDLGYRIGDTYTIETNPIVSKNETEYIYRVLKRFRHLISKENIIT